MKKLLNQRIFYSLILLVAVFLVYFPILGNDFLYRWDDQWVVINHYTEGGLTFQNLKAVFTEFYHGQYAPLNAILYVFLYIVFGYEPFWFHLASLSLHAINALLVLHCITLLLRYQSRIQVSYPWTIAFLTAFIFSVHPLNVESVAWVSASKVLVYAFYYLLATISFLRFLQSGKLLYYIVTLVLFICSFLGKEQAVVFPLWILLMYWWTGRDLRQKKMWVVVMPFFALALAFGIITMLSQSAVQGGMLSSEASYPLWHRFVYACYAFSEYLTKCLFPIKLSYLYPFPSVIGDPLPVWLLVYPALLLIAITAFYKQLWKNKLIAFYLLFFIIHIAVALHIIPLSRFAVVADRYIYISSIGISFIIAYVAVNLWIKRTNPKRFLLILFMTTYIGYLGIYAHTRTYVWHTTDTLKKAIREILEQRHDYEIQDKQLNNSK